jgi:hypothetical protein
MLSLHSVFVRACISRSNWLISHHNSSTNLGMYTAGASASRIGPDSENHVPLVIRDQITMTSGVRTPQCEHGYVMKNVFLLAIHLNPDH